MSLNKNEFENLRLHAQKCDHRMLAPVTSFDLAADLRANRGRGGKMFEKRKQRSDKFVVEDSDPNLIPGHDLGTPGPKLFAPQAHPAIWTPPSAQASKQVIQKEFMDHVNRNRVPRDAEDSVDNLSDTERLQKLYRILHYSPPEDLMQIQPAQAPKVDLKSSSASRVPAARGRNFNRNAKGWCATDDERLLETANPAPRPTHLSGLLAVDVDCLDYSPTSPDPERQEPHVHGSRKPRPKSWHAVTVTLEELGPEDEVVAGDYNPRPKAWQPAIYEEDEWGPQEVLQFGDYNLKPKPWTPNEEEEEPSFRSEVQYGDYNPRPKAWMSKHRKGRSKMRQGDYNARSRPWKSSERAHFHLQKDTDSQSGMKFGDFNARAKAWKSSGSEHSSSTHVGRTRYGNFNVNPKAWKTRRSESPGKGHYHYKYYHGRPASWRSAPDDDSSSTTSSYSSSEYSDDEYSYASTPYSRGSIPACDV